VLSAVTIARIDCRLRILGLRRRRAAAMRSSESAGLWPSLLRQCRHLRHSATSASADQGQPPLGAPPLRQCAGSKV